MIDWLALANEVFYNHTLPAKEKNELFDLLKRHMPASVTSHIFLTTSGSSGKLKWVALSKQAVLVSADAVNKHLQASSSDIWLNPLPLFHVGGLGILARGYLSCSKVIASYEANRKWDVHHFVATVKETKATLTSLVPAQVFDIVFHNLNAPKSLRAVVVGGGRLSEDMYIQAIALGWPLLPSYGMTECASQIATADLSSIILETAVRDGKLMQDLELESLCNGVGHSQRVLDHPIANNSGSRDCVKLPSPTAVSRIIAGKYPLLTPLSHLQVKSSETGNLMVKGASLLTAYIDSNWRDPKTSDGWFIADDIAIFCEGSLKSCSRAYAFIKIGGESVDLNRLDAIFEDTLMACQGNVDAALCPFPDPRLGHVIHLAIGTSTHVSKAFIDTLIMTYNERVLPFEKIRLTHCVPSIPRSALKKVLRSELIKLIK